MNETDGSIVAEGMVLAVRTRHPRVRELLRGHLGDRRWNWYLQLNDGFARQLLDRLDGKPVESWVEQLLAERTW